MEENSNMISLGIMCYLEATVLIETEVMVLTSHLMLMNAVSMGIISKFYPIFCGNNNDTYFLSLVLNNSDEVVHEIAYTCTGTGQKVLSFLDLQKMSIRVPRQEEQKKTSAFF